MLVERTASFLPIIWVGKRSDQKRSAMPATDLRHAPMLEVDLSTGPSQPGQLSLFNVSLRVGHAAGSTRALTGPLRLSLE